MRFLTPVLLIIFALLLFVTLPPGPVWPGLLILMFTLLIGALVTFVVGLRDASLGRGDAKVELELRELRKQLAAVEERLSLTEDELERVRIAAEFDVELKRESPPLSSPGE